MALQPDPTHCHLPAPGASGAPTAIKEQSKHLLLLDFTASHNLGITYGDILNFTPLPATCSQYLATGLASSCIHHLHPPHMAATNLPMLLLGLECALFLLLPLPNTRLSSTSSNPPSPPILSCYDLQTPVTSLLGILTMTAANVNLWQTKVSVRLTTACPPTHPPTHLPIHSLQLDHKLFKVTVLPFRCHIGSGAKDT